MAYLVFYSGQRRCFATWAMARADGSLRNCWRGCTDVLAVDDWAMSA
jgi:hypothetical protein